MRGTPADRLRRAAERAELGHPYGRVDAGQRGALERGADLAVGHADPAGRPEATELLGGFTSPWGLVALKNGTLLMSERDTKQILLVDGDAKDPLRTIDEAQPVG